MAPESVAAKARELEAATFERDVTSALFHGAAEKDVDSPRVQDFANQSAEATMAWMKVNKDFIEAARQDLKSR